MDFESIRPIISGIVGGVISLWLIGRLGKGIPRSFGAKGAEELVQENKTKIIVSNVLFFANIAGGFLLYHYGYFERDDWRGLALAFGSATISPVVFLLFASIGSGNRQIKEALLAYAISQRVPFAILYGAFAIGAACFFAALASMIGR